VPDAWDPAQYERFARERRQPFDDLLTLVAPLPGGRAVDLGCGPGELTVELHHHTGAATTLGLDSSAAMLERAPTVDGVRFEVGDLTTFTDDEPLDLVVASASLQWVPDHEVLLPRLASLLAPGGQLAVQMPNNHDHPSHTVITEVATEEPFASALGGGALPDPVAVNVLRPERYAELLHSLGFATQHVRLQVYGHVLESSAEVVDWTRGTSLTRYKQALPGDLYERFVDRYRERLVARLGDRRPYFFAFKRILVWGRLPAPQT
jgi:trans-aconitate 2-methyltransferase